MEKEILERKYTKHGIFKGGSEEFWLENECEVLKVCGECKKYQDCFRLKPIQSLYAYEKNNNIKLNIDHHCKGTNKILISNKPSPGYEPWYLYCCRDGGLCRRCIKNLKPNHSFYL